MYILAYHDDDGFLFTKFNEYKDAFNHMLYMGRDFDHWDQIDNEIKSWFSESTYEITEDALVYKSHDYNMFEKIDRNVIVNNRDVVVWVTNNTMTIVERGDWGETTLEWEIVHFEE